MTEVVSISDAKLKRLQTLYSQLAARSADGSAKTREARLTFVSIIVNREITSFRELTSDEADKCIGRLQEVLGPAAKSTRPKPARRMSPERALRHGKDGRYDSCFDDAPQLASEPDLARIQEYRARVGWSMEQFEAWLRSPRSPLGRNPRIRTIAEANKVRWALVKMLKSRGLWMEKPPEKAKSAHMCAPEAAS